LTLENVEIYYFRFDTNKIINKLIFKIQYSFYPTDDYKRDHDAKIFLTEFWVFNFLKEKWVNNLIIDYLSIFKLYKEKYLK